MQGVSAKDINGKLVALKTGQGICIYNIKRKKVDETSRIFLANYDETYDLGSLSDKELFFDVSKNRYGAACFAGIPEYELFGTNEIIDSQNRQVVDLKPWEQIDYVSRSNRYVMHIDWDRDGIEDELSFELMEYSEDAILYFRNGEDGSSVRKRMNLDCWDEFLICVSTETLMLVQKPNGEYVLFTGENISTFLKNGESEQGGTCVVAYDDDEVFSKKAIYNVYEHVDNVLYVTDFGEFFGDNWTIKTAVRINDDLSYERLSETNYYLFGWFEYTYSIQDVHIEIEGDSGYAPAILHTGTVVIPEKSVLNSEGKGYLYVRLVDGQIARIKAEYTSENYHAILDGKTDYDVFYVPEFFRLYQGDPTE